MPAQEEQITVRDEVLAEFNKIADKVTEVQRLVESLEAQLEVAKGEKTGVQTELVRMLDLADREGKWLADARERIVKITAWSQQKQIPWQKMYELAYGKLAPQIKNVLDPQLQTLREAAGSFNQLRIKVTQRGGGIWDAIQKGWDWVKDEVVAIASSATSALQRLIGGQKQIDATLDEMEDLVGEVYRGGSCKKLAEELKIQLDCNDKSIQAIARTVAVLGNTEAEKVVKEKYIATLKKLQKPIATVVTIIDAKSAKVNAKIVKGATEEEMLQNAFDEIEKYCNCGKKAGVFLQQAVVRYIGSKQAEEEIPVDAVDTAAEVGGIVKDLVKEVKTDIGDAGDVINDYVEQVQMTTANKAKVFGAVIEGQPEDILTGVVAELKKQCSDCSDDDIDVIVADMVNRFVVVDKQALTLDEATKKKSENDSAGKKSEIREVSTGNYEVIVTA